jgi:hypothetical protein
LILPTPNPKEERVDNPKIEKGNNICKTRNKIVQKYIQRVGNGSNKWHSPLKGPYKAVTEAKVSQIKTNLFEPQLENDSNHRKEAETEDALSKSDARTEEGRGTNIDLVTKVSIKGSNHK